MPAGRPLQLTSEIIETILDLMIAIPHLKTIAVHVGVCARTLRRWFKSGNDEWARRCEGEDPDTRLDLHYRLAKEYGKTSALIMTYHLDFVQQGFPGWRRHAKQLESRFPDELGPDTRILRRLRRRLAALDEIERIYSSGINSSGTTSSGSDSTIDPGSLDASSSNKDATTDETAGTGDKIPFDENASAKRLLESRINKGLRSIQDIDTIRAILREDELLRQFVKEPEQFTNHNFVDVDYYLAQGIKRDWRAWAWFLERRFPKEFGRNRIEIRHLKGILAARKVLANCKNTGSISATDRAKAAKIKRKYLNEELSLESDDEDLVDDIPSETKDKHSIDDLPSESDDDEDSIDDLLSDSNEDGREPEDLIGAESMSTWQKAPQLPEDPELWSEGEGKIPDEPMSADESEPMKVGTASTGEIRGEFHLMDFISRLNERLNLVDPEPSDGDAIEHQETSADPASSNVEADRIPDEPISEDATPPNLPKSLEECLEFLHHVIVSSVHFDQLTDLLEELNKARGAAARTNLPSAPTTQKTTKRSKRQRDKARPKAPA